jgi:hypothetical protein
MAVDKFCVINILNTTFINAFQHLFFQTSQTIQNNLKGSKMSKGGGTCIKSASANSVVVKQRWLFCILILILFVISANIGITALLLYYINVTNVRRSILPKITSFYTLFQHLLELCQLRTIKVAIV